MRKHHNCSGRQILLFPNFSMLGSHRHSRYLASSPIAFQLFQNLKSGQILHHNALEKLRCFLSNRSQFFNLLGCLDRSTMNLCSQVFQQIPKNYLHPPQSKLLLLNPALTESIQDTSPRMNPGRNKKPVSDETCPPNLSVGSRLQFFNLKSQISNRLTRDNLRSPAVFHLP